MTQDTAHLADPASPTYRLATSAEIQASAAGEQRQRNARLMLRGLQASFPHAAKLHFFIRESDHQPYQFLVEDASGRTLGQADTPEGTARFGFLMGWNEEDLRELSANDQFLVISVDQLNAPMVQRGPPLYVREN